MQPCTHSVTLNYFSESIHLSAWGVCMYYPAKILQLTGRIIIHADSLHIAPIPAGFFDNS